VTGTVGWTRLVCGGQMAHQPLTEAATTVRYGAAQGYPGAADWHTLCDPTMYDDGGNHGGEACGALVWSTVHCCWCAHLTCSCGSSRTQMVALPLLKVNCGPALHLLRCTHVILTATCAWDHTTVAVWHPNSVPVLLRNCGPKSTSALCTHKKTPAPASPAVHFL
jgi:hypothetical protein